MANSGNQTGDDALLARIAAALERLAPSAMSTALPGGDAFVWEPAQGGLVAVPHVAHVDLKLLKGIENQRDTLVANTSRFAEGLPANNALLWGARGMGKSSLVKAVHEQVNEGRKGEDRLVLIEIHREDIDTLPALLRILRASKRRIVLLLRRSFLRQGRYQLQIAEGGAGRRHRRPARQHHSVCHLQPAAPDAARPGGQ